MSIIENGFSNNISSTFHNALYRYLIHASNTLQRTILQNSLINDISVELIEPTNQVIITHLVNEFLGYEIQVSLYPTKGLRLYTAGLTTRLVIWVLS